MDTPVSMNIPAHRACALCRSQKVRCIPEDGRPDICQRCDRLGRPCIVTPLQKRKQRKRTDTRVAELEREMRAMRVLLDQKARFAERSESSTLAESGIDEGQVGDAPGSRQTPEQASAVRGQESRRRKPLADSGDSRRSLTVDGAVRPQGTTLEETGELDTDVVGRGLVSMATARELVDVFKDDLFYHFYFVVLRPWETADVLRQTKPTLFLAVMAAAAGSRDPILSKTLDQEILQMYATKVHVRSEKALEIVQALLLSAVWYAPPDRFGHLKYYEYIHMALTMAFDIGIGSRPLQRKAQPPAGSVLDMHAVGESSKFDLPSSSRKAISKQADEDAEVELERRRTFIAVWSICAGVSFSMRRPAMLHINSYVRNCMEYIDTAQHALASDRIMMHWVKMIALSEEISTAFSYDDSVAMASFSDLSTRMMLKDFDRRLTDIWQNVRQTDRSFTLKLNYYTARLFLYEVALHVEHAPDDFKAPYQLGVLQPPDASIKIPTKALAEAVADIIRSCHGLLDAFLEPEPSSMRGLPVVYFVRLSLAAFILAKLTLSASHPGSRIGQVLDRDSLQVTEYLTRILAHMSEIVGAVKLRTPAIFVALLYKLKLWCASPQSIAPTPDVKSAPLQIEAEEVPWNSGYGDHGYEFAEEGIKIAGTSSSNASPETGTGPSSAKTQGMPAETPNRATYQSLPSHQVGNGQNAARSDHEAFYIPDTGAEDANAFPYDTSWFPSDDEMDLDSSLFDPLGIATGLPEGGLTGLDDWYAGDIPFDPSFYDGSSTGYGETGS